MRPLTRLALLLMLMLGALPTAGAAAAAVSDLAAGAGADSLRSAPADVAEAGLVVIAPHVRVAPGVRLERVWQPDAGGTPAPAPLAAKSQQLLQEDFEDGVANGFVPLAGSWQVVGGEYFTRVEMAGLEHRSRAGDLNWRDYRLQMDLRADGGADQRLHFRCTENGDRYTLVVRASPYDDIWLRKTVADSTATLLQITGYLNSNLLSVPYTVEVVGATITARRGGDELFVLTDAEGPLLRGGIACGAFAGAALGWQEVYCDNVVVTALGTITSRFADFAGWPAALNDPGRAAGTAWVDFDGDGLLDVWVAGAGGDASVLARNEGLGGFTRVDVPVLQAPQDLQGTCWGDYDRDGDLDLYVAGLSGGNRLLRNDGGGSFTDVTAGDASGNPAGNAAVTWLDLDGDGHLDLYVVNALAPNLYLAGDGLGGFTSVPCGLLADTGAGVEAAWGDYDGDGDMDVYLTKSGEPNLLLRNDGFPVFVNVTSGALADGADSRGAAWGDYDGDGDLDLYVVNAGTANRLLRNDGGGIFTDVTSGVLGDPASGRSAAWGDYDNDGDLDLFLTNHGAADRLFTSLGGGLFGEVEGQNLADSSDGVGAAWGDMDGDGDLDLSVANAGQANHVYTNELVSEHHWIHVALTATLSAPGAFGTRVTVTAGGVTMIREVGTDGGLWSAGSPVLEFGLGSASVVDTLVVRWPSGLVHEYTQVTADQVVPLVESDQQAGSALVLEPAVTGPVACDDSFTASAVYHPGFTTVPLRGYSIRLVGSPGLEFGAGDVQVNVVPSGSNAIFEVLGNGPGDVTVDYTVTGTGACVQNTATLFTVTVRATADGTGSIAVAHADCRDENNQAIFVDHDAVSAVTVDCSPPAPPSGLDARPGHQQVEITWADPPESDVTEMLVYRSLWHDGAMATAYPAYGQMAGDVVPARHDTVAGYEASSEWTLLAQVPQGMQAFTDTVAVRGAYFYEVFAVDATGNVSAPPAAWAGATSYVLGDFAVPHDGLVDIADLNALGDSYGIACGNPLYDPETDVGPTDTGGGDGIPLPDCAVNFDDLMIVGFNFGLVEGAAPPAVRSPAVAGRVGTQAEAVALAWERLDERTWVCRLLAPCASLKGLRLLASLPADPAIAIAAVTPGELVSGGPVPVFLARARGRDLDVAIVALGPGATVTGAGELLRVELTAAAAMAQLQAEARDLGNAALAVDLGAGDPPSVVRRFSLAQNFPNPFNPATSIIFELPRAGRVDLAVYGLDGRRVRTLLAEAPHGAGRHEVIWDGADDAGRRVASGTYFYRLRSGDRMASRKMILAK
ncbi:MAG: FG-GAP-like repeat-containing protein [Candidatus Krumholzibacteriia bacterium]